MKKIILLLLVLPLLPACIPAAFVTGAAAGGSVIYDNRPTKTIVEDRNITFQIQHKLDLDQDLHQTAHVSVTSFNHIVLLIGQTPTRELRSRAAAIAKSSPKVRMLYNEITIEKPISDLAIANDTWITTKIKTVLMATPGLSSATLKVVTENGVVYLMGLTSRTQAQIATNKTRTVAGVKKIIKLFEYLN